MTIYISPNPGKTSAYEIALRAAQILLTHGAAVLMCKELCAECSTAGVVYLPQEECLERSDVILTIGGDGTILHEANLSLRYAKPILGINLGRCGFLATCEIGEMETKQILSEKASEANSAETHRETINAHLDSLQTEIESLLDVTLTISAYNYLDDDNYKKAVRRSIMTGNFIPSYLYPTPSKNPGFL